VSERRRDCQGDRRGSAWPPLDCDTARQGIGASARQNGIPRDGVLPDAGERRTPRAAPHPKWCRGAGARGLANVDQVPSAPGTVAACSRYVVLSARFRAGVYRWGAYGAATGTPQLIALSARSERLSRSLSSWARSAGRSLGGSV
jgi:hypothetical protein